jgi:hypothetical protein
MMWCTIHLVKTLLSRLLGSTGGVMGIACAKSHIPDNTRVAAVASSIWTEYYKASEASLQGRQLDMLLLDMEVRGWRHSET